MLRLQGLTLRFSCFITKATASIGRGEQKGSQCKAVWDWPAGCTADGKLGQDVLWDYRLLEQCACVVYLCATPCYLFSWQTEEIKRNITLVVASCDKQIVGILNLLKHLTQGTGVTFKIKFDRHSGRGVLEWNLIGRQRKEVLDRHPGHLKREKLTYVLASIHIVKLDLHPVWSNQCSQIRLIKFLNEVC